MERQVKLKVDAGDEQDFKELAKALFETSDSRLEKLVEDGKYIEVICDAQDQDL